MRMRRGAGWFGLGLGLAYVAGRGLGRATREEPMEVKAAVTVVEDAETAYALWRDFARFPRFMAHVESVEERADGTTHWRVASPTGTVEWDAQTVEDVPGERIAWRSLPGADVETSGAVRFLPAPAGRGTEIHLELRYRAPAGSVGALVAKLMGQEPTQQAKDDLRRFKQLLETGEIARSDAVPGGTDASKTLRQRAAQPVEEIAR